MMKRRELREHIFELLFRIEFNSSEEMPEQMQLFFDGLDELGEQDQSYMEEKYRRIVEKLPELDRRIEETAKSWRISRMGKVDLNLTTTFPWAWPSTRRWSFPKNSAEKIPRPL